MKSEKITVAVYGKTLLANLILIDKLNKKFDVFICKSINQFWNTLEKKSIQVLLLEIGANGKELKILKQLKTTNPKLYIISLGFEKPKEHLIKAYKNGSKDFFKMPFNVDLLIERIEGIVKRNKQQYKCN